MADVHDSERADVGQSNDSQHKAQVMRDEELNEKWGHAVTSRSALLLMVSVDTRTNRRITQILSHFMICS